MTTSGGSGSDQNDDYYGRTRLRPKCRLLRSDPAPTKTMTTTGGSGSDQNIDYYGRIGLRKSGPKGSLNDEKYFCFLLHKSIRYEIVSNERNDSIKITGGQQTEEKKHKLL